MRKTKVTAHAGCIGTPKDSLESVVKGIEIGADICEIDVNSLIDGTPVLKHDPITSKDTNLVKVSDVFEYACDKNIIFNLDIKNYAVFDRLIPLINYYKLDKKVFFTGIDSDTAEKLYMKSCEIEYFLNHDLKPKALTFNYTEYINNIIDTMKKFKCIGINSNYRFCSYDAVKRIQDAGFLVSLWTVDNKEDMEKYLDMEVDNITTRRPDLLINIRDFKFKSFPAGFKT